MRPTVFLGLIVLLVLAGCESFTDAASNLREKFERREAAQTKTFATHSRATYDAVRAAAAQMGYRFVRGGPAQGEFEGLSGVAPGEVNRSARQFAMKVQLRPTLDEKGTEVTVRLTEIVEADSSNRAGMATEAPLRDTPQYQVFFRQVQATLDASASGK